MDSIIGNLELFGDKFRYYKQNLKTEMEGSSPFMENFKGKRDVNGINWRNFYVLPELLLKDKTDPNKPEKKISTIDEIIELGEKGPKEFIITGEPGIGKTTFLRYAAWELCEKDLFPVHVRLGEHHNVSLEEHLQGAVEKHDPELRRNLEKDLIVEWKSGRTVFLFDALDESPNQREATEQIQSLRETYRGNYFLITIRTNQFLPDKWSNFQQLEMQPFSEEKVKEYLKKKLGEKESETVYSKIKEYHLEDFARLPLMLRFLTEIKENEIRTVKNRSDLYTLFIETKFADRENKQKDEQQRSLVPPQYKAQILAELALFMQTDPKTIEEFSGNRVGYVLAQEKLRCYAKYHKEFPSWKDYQTKEKMTPQDIVNEIESNGLIVKKFIDERKVYSFFHKTVQEYLAACAIANRIEGRMDGIFDLEKARKDKSLFTVDPHITIRDFVNRYVRYEDKTFP